MQVDYIQAGETPAHTWRLRARTLTDLSFPVPTFQPTTPGVPMAVDLHPLGPNPVESPGNGFTWLDTVSGDVMLDNSTPVMCGRVGVGTIFGNIAGYVGSVPFNGMVAQNFYVRVGNIYPWAWNYNGVFYPTADNTYQIGSSTYRPVSIYAVNGTLQTSDGREKTDIQPTKLGLDFIMNLVPVSYRWKKGEERHQGVIAQNVLASANGEPCGVSGDERLSLNYSELIGPLIKAVQELSEKVRVLSRSA